MLNRKHFLKGGLAVAMLASVIVPEDAVSDTVFRVLSEAAVRVKDSSEVVLISITRVQNRLVAVGEHGVIILSDENGKEWRQASVPVNVSITCVAFVTAQHGWAAGDYGVILKTQDGGETWQLQIDGTQINQIMLATAQKLSDENSGSPLAERALRRANIFVEGGPDRPFLCILPLSVQKAIVFGSYRMAMLTLDGGKIWQDISLSIDDPISHNIYGLTVQGNRTYLAGETGVVFQSSDGDQNFVQVTQPVRATLFGILGSGQNLVVYGVAGNIFWSKDQGKTWTQTTIETRANITAGRVLSSGQVVVATEDGSFFVSKDGGVTFGTASFNAGTSLFDFEQATNDDIVFVGEAGVKSVPLSAFI